MTPTTRPAPRSATAAEGARGQDADLRWLGAPLKVQAAQARLIRRGVLLPDPTPQRRPGAESGADSTTAPR